MNNLLLAAANRVSLSSDLREARYGEEVLAEPSPNRMVSALARVFYNDLHAGISNGLSIRPSAWHDAEIEREAEKLVDRVPIPTRVRKIADLESQVIVSLGGVEVLVERKSPAYIYNDNEEHIVLLSNHRPRESPGFYSVTSPGRPFRRIGPIVRLYVRAESSVEALAHWPRIIEALSRVDGGWRTKILASASAYPRNDAIVVYLTRPAWKAIDEVSAVVGLIGHPGFAGSAAASTSIYTRQIAHNVALSFEPSDNRPGYKGLSFGQHRSRVIADAVVRSHQAGTDLEETLVESLNFALVDAVSPWRNLTSPDIENFVHASGIASHE